MTRQVVGALALLLVLAGCGGDPRADPSPSPSSPATSPVSTTPSAPVMPEDAKADTKAGAIAFVKYYVELINRLQQTGDGAALKRASEPTCKSCKAVIRAANEIYDKGGHQEGGAWIITNLDVTRPTATLWAVRVRGELAPSKVVDGPSSVPTAGSGGPANAEFFLTFDQVWKVAQWHTG